MSAFTLLASKVFCRVAFDVQAVCRLLETSARFCAQIMAQLGRYRFLFIAVVFHLIYIYRCGLNKLYAMYYSTDAL
jgi:hypothetical protein